MDMIMMEKSDFDRLIGRIDEIAEHIRKSEKSKSPERADRWLSGKEARQKMPLPPLGRGAGTGHVQN